KDVNVMISGRYRMMSAFDRSYMDQVVTPGSHLNRQLTQIRGFHSDKHNIWHFSAFSIDPEMKDQDLVFFVLACLPEKIATMTEGLEHDFDPRLVDLMRKPPRSGLDNAGIVMGATQLTKLHKRVGDVFKAKSLMHREGTGLRLPIEMEFEIVGVIPQ